MKFKHLEECHVVIKLNICCNITSTSAKQHQHHIYEPQEERPVELQGEKSMTKIMCCRLRADFTVLILAVFFFSHFTVRMGL